MVKEHNGAQNFRLPYPELVAYVSGQSLKLWNLTLVPVVYKVKPSQLRLFTNP